MRRSRRGRRIDVAAWTAAGGAALAAIAVGAPAVSIGQSDGHRARDAQPAAHHGAGHAPASSSSKQSKATASSRPAAHAAQVAQPRYVPPLHGTNPHGQGTLGVLDTQPSTERPLSGDPTGKESSEEIVVGRARGEERAPGEYHGHITILAAFGNEILGIDTTEGQDKQFNPIQQQVLDEICAQSGNAICVKVVSARSKTGDKFSDNIIEIASARLTNPSDPTQSLVLGAGKSRGLIADASVLRTAAGDSPLIEPVPGVTADPCAGARGQVGFGFSNVADAAIAGNPVANVLTSAVRSIACAGQAPKVEVAGQVLLLGGEPVPLPAEGCGSGAPNTVFAPDDALAPLLTLICNATDVEEGVNANVDDGNTVSQAPGEPTPYGVREALTALLLEDNVKLTAAASESLAKVPSAEQPPTTKKPPTQPDGQPPTEGPDGGTQGQGGAGDDGDDGDGGGGTAGAGGEGDDGGADGAGAPVADTQAATRPECTDGVDNDGDGKIDFPNDPQCESALDNSEAGGARPECSDGVDNDGDGKIDFPNDPQCESRQDDSEAGALPFTGAGVGGMTVGGLLLLATGLVLRRRLHTGRAAG